MLEGFELVHRVFKKAGKQILRLSRQEKLLMTPFTTDSGDKITALMASATGEEEPLVPVSHLTTI